jgi:hypothetical protein
VTLRLCQQWQAHDLQRTLARLSQIPSGLTVFPARSNLPDPKAETNPLPNHFHFPLFLIFYC